MNMKSWTLPSWFGLIDVVGFLNSVGFVRVVDLAVKILGLVVSMSLPPVLIEVSLLIEVWPAMEVSLNEFVSVIFVADVDSGLVGVVVRGVNVAKWSDNLLLYHDDILPTKLKNKSLNSIYLCLKYFTCIWTPSKWTSCVYIITATQTIYLYSTSIAFGSLRRVVLFEAWCTATLTIVISIRMRARTRAISPYVKIWKNDMS